MADVPPDLDNASHAELKELVQTLLERVNALERENAALRDEVARLNPDYSATEHLMYAASA